MPDHTYSEDERKMKWKEYENTPETIQKLDGCKYMIIPETEWSELWDKHYGVRQAIFRELEHKYDIVIQYQSFDSIINACVLIVKYPNDVEKVGQHLSHEELLTRTGVGVCNMSAKN